jgi:hypothetical protein
MRVDHRGSIEAERMTMTEENEEVDLAVCGENLAPLRRTCELRWEAFVGLEKTLQQKWVAEARDSDGTVHRRHVWRDVPNSR